MAQETGPLAGIIDIELPVTPPLGAEDTALAIVAALLLLAVVAYFLRRRYQSPRARARRRLSALQHHYAQQKLDGRHAAFELAAILRDFFGTNHLSTETPSHRRMPVSSVSKPLDSGIRRNDETIETRWHDLVDCLSTARYSPRDLDPAQLDALFRDAREWLRHTL